MSGVLIPLVCWVTRCLDGRLLLFSPIANGSGSFCVWVFHLMHPKHKTENPLMGPHTVSCHATGGPKRHRPKSGNLAGLSSRLAMAIRAGVHVLEPFLISNPGMVPGKPFHLAGV
jgi:hypothetical protein